MTFAFLTRQAGDADGDKLPTIAPCRPRTFSLTTFLAEQNFFWCPRLSWATSVRKILWSCMSGGWVTLIHYYPLAFALCGCQHKSLLAQLRKNTSSLQQTLGMSRHKQRPTQSPEKRRLEIQMFWLPRVLYFVRLACRSRLIQWWSSSTWWGSQSRVHMLTGLRTWDM